MMNKITVSAAVEIAESIKPVKLEHTVNIENAAGHILAKSVYAKYSVPIAPLSAMDGFSVITSQTTSASAENKITLTDFKRVNTGNAIDVKYDAVIKVEDVEFTGEKPETITISEPAEKGSNIRITGEDISEGRLILAEGTKIRPFDIGAIAAYGVTEVFVKSLKIGVIPTGTELITAGQTPKAGDVVESNTIMIAAYLKEFGADIRRYAPVDDEKNAIAASLKKALAENDIVLISAGSSMGSKDFTSSVIEELGELKFHGVFMKPAKPSMLGVINGKPVFGLPGFPLSAQTTIREIVTPLLNKWGWFRYTESVDVPAVSGGNFKSDSELDEFSFAAVGNVNEKYVALPQLRASSVQMNGIRANAIVRISRGIKKINAGDEITAVINVPLADLEKTILIAGRNSAAVEKLVEKAALAGFSIRCGAFDETAAAELLEKKYCHAVCTSKDFILPDGIKSVKIPEDEILVFREDMEIEPRLSALLTFAGSE
ncbi:MAG: molybdopterin-binding protein [Methanocorpusculum sp.]|nr:molybdopterin-binding protein [Methanocorpusculum sp.]